MEDGGITCLFDFVVKAHNLIEVGKLDICEWHRITKIMFQQMMESVEYIHSKNVAHFDISLENFVLNDMDVVLVTTAENEEKIKFCVIDRDNNGDGCGSPSSSGIQVKLCDFGLSEVFPNDKLRGKPDFQSTKYCGKV